jgi:hypothetical protein
VASVNALDRFRSFDPADLTRYGHQLLVEAALASGPKA